MKSLAARGGPRETWIVVLASIAIVACARRAPAVVYVTTPPPETRPSAPIAPVTPEAPAQRPPPSVVSQCNARLVTRTSEAPEAHRAEAIVQNITNTPLRFVVPSRCPFGVAAFEGLGDDYDYYGACAMGACRQPQSPRSFTVPPGGEVVVASATIHHAGTSCQPPLSAGTYTLRFTIPGADGLDVCAVDHGVIEVTPPSTTERTDPPSTPARPRRDCPAIACACFGVPQPTPPGECPSCNCVEGPSFSRDPTR